MKKAFRWWQRAAKQDYDGAQYNIAVILKDDLGVRKDADEALRWLTVAAKQGNTDAHIQLSLLHRTGDGVAQDPVLSHMWLEIAQLSGSVSADRSLDAQAAELSAAQVADAKVRAQTWLRDNPLKNAP